MSRALFATVSHMLFNPSSQICLLVHVHGRHEPWPHGRIRSNESESIKQYPCLLGLFWPGAFHLIRTRCITNKVFFSCHSSPTHSLQPLSSVNIWNFRIIQKNCVAEHLLNLGALWAGYARADFTWVVMNSHSVNAPSEFHGVFLCLDLRSYTALQSVCLCNQECVRVGCETVSLYILLIHSYPLPKSFPKASRDH